MEKAIFAAGCFWGVEALFRRTPGVKDVACGYCNGTTENPTYEHVCRGNTNHAEVVEVIFDPNEISYEELVRVFFSGHNPTTPNQQGPDYGTQYRSAIFYTSDTQRDTAQHIKATLDATDTFRAPIVTEITPAQPFYRAEEYHQQYLNKQGMDDCHI